MPQRSSLTQPRGGREEIRAALLRPALLHLRAKAGPAAPTAVLFEAGLNESEIAHDSAWISATCARTVLRQVIKEAGEEAVSSRGRYAITPDVLGPYMRLLRQAPWPRDGYEHLVSAGAEAVRIGRYSLVDLTDTSATIRYTPDEDFEESQADRCLCLIRQAELKALPELWALPEASLKEGGCISRGDVTCEYHLRWKPVAQSYAPLAGALGALVAATPLGLTFGPVQAALGAVGGAALGAAGAFLQQQQAKSSALRARERHRIIALEHSLEQRGQLQPAVGDLTHSVLGGKYKILRSVGSGGIGTVYAAEHLGLGFQVAVKVLRGAAADDASEVARLRREARIQMSLEHPNIVRTFDLDQLPDGTLYVVMELLQGVSLHDQLRRKSPLPPGFVIPVYLQACRALSAAHRLGIVHRDLKPGNIFLCEGGTVKVLDFGMSKLAQEDSLTQDGYTLGTPEYMSPEQCVGGDVDARSDVYAFGVLMYESLTGDLPFRSSNRKALLEHHQRTAPRSMRRARPDLDIPEELDHIVLTCLEKSPAKRPESAEKLERLLAQVPPARVKHVYPHSTPRRLPQGGFERPRD